MRMGMASYNSEALLWVLARRFCACSYCWYLVRASPIAVAVSFRLGWRPTPPPKHHKEWVQHVLLIVHHRLFCDERFLRKVREEEEGGRACSMRALRDKK
eukprot:1148309-Pelagomonas_calceolata.AAC.1